MKFNFECEDLDGLVIMDKAYIDELDNETLYDFDICLDRKGKSELIYDFPNEKWEDVYSRAFHSIERFCADGKMILFLLHENSYDCNIDINFWLIGDILLKADKMSMAHSLEVRVPFLDKEVFNVARTIPTKYKVNKSNTKYAMRQAAHRHLPDMVAEKKKLGFPVPIRIWLKDEKYYNMIKKAFTSEAAEKYFNTDEIVKYLDDHKEGKADNSRKIWTIYMFLVWYEDFFGNGVKEAA